MSSGYEYFQSVLYIMPIIVHVATLVVIALDPKLRSGAGCLLSIYVILALLRNLCLLSYPLLPDTLNIRGYTFTFFEFASVYTQTKTLGLISKSLGSGLPTITDAFTLPKLIGQLLLVLGVSVLLYLVINIMIQVIDLVLLYCGTVFMLAFYRIVLSPILIMFCPLPLTVYNTVKCVSIAVKVRAVRRAVKDPQLKKHGGAQLEWQSIFLKMIFISGLQTDLMFCGFALPLHLEYFGVSHGSGPLFYVIKDVWFLRGIEIFFVFVCKKEVWNRLKRRFSGQ